MREIKFNGKDSIGSWWYGNLIARRIITDDKDITVYALQGITNNHYCSGINPDTIGQFTGWKDKAGKDIYEGDILKNKFGKKYVVIYNTENKCICLFPPSVYASMLNDALTMYNELINKTTASGKHFRENEFEIIGNMYDNLKMIKLE